MKKLILSSLIGLILYTDSFAKGQFTCEPAVDCINASPGDMVPDPNNCEKYYVCIELPDGSIRPSTSPLQCEPGFYFNQTAKACTSEITTGTCQNECNRICEFLCPAPFVSATYVANRNNCSTYIACLQSSQMDISCIAETPYFNGQQCVKYASQCCNFCTPYCNQVNTEIQDPCDCTSFYICLTEGTPSESNKGTCGEGEYFDENITQCLPGPCNSICTTSHCTVAGRTTI